MGSRSGVSLEESLDPAPLTARFERLLSDGVRIEVFLVGPGLIPALVRGWVVDLHYVDLP